MSQIANIAEVFKTRIDNCDMPAEVAYELMVDTLDAIGYDWHDLVSADEDEIGICKYYELQVEAVKKMLGE